MLFGWTVNIYSAQTIFSAFLYISDMRNIYSSFQLINYENILIIEMQNASLCLNDFTNFDENLK